VHKPSVWVTGGEIRNVSVLAAIGVGEDGYRKVLGIAEGHKEDKAGRGGFLINVPREAEIRVSDSERFDALLSRSLCLALS